MENIVYSKSEFFDSINSSYKSVLKKKTNPSTYHEQRKNTVEGGSGDKTDKSQRQLQTCQAHPSFAFPSPCSLLSRSWCPCCSGATLGEWGQTGLGYTNSAQLGPPVPNSFSPGLEDKWFNNPECCALCFSKVDSAFSLTQVSPTSSWENAEQTEIAAWTPRAGLVLFAFYYKAYLAVSYG